MFRKKAEHLLFGTGMPVRIRVGGQEKVILDKAVRTEQIIKLLNPISEGCSFEGDGERSFHYESPTGTVHVRALVQGERMSAIVSPQLEVLYEGYSPEEDSLSVDVGPKQDKEGEPSTPPAEPPATPISQDSESPFPHSPPPASSSIQLPFEDLPPSGEDTKTPPPQPEPPSRPPSRSQPRRGPSSRGPSRVAHSESRNSPSVETEAPSDFSINKILRQLVELGGSDLHLTAGHPPMFRKDGDMTRLEGWDEISSETIESWLIEAAHEGARDEFYESHDADFAHEIEGVARFRMNMFRDRNGVGGVMRTIPSSVLTADQLGLPDVIRRLCTLPKGLVLVTGPTGSGKSTTLAAMIDLINETRRDHIITIEDPVEFVHKSKTCLVNQREVHTHTRSFSTALRAALREDPDIVLVGELRDLETVHIAIETAETGHLVFGTLHTNTAPSTVDRIIDQFPSDRQAQIRVMLSESLRGVVSQTLLRKKGGGRVAALEILVVNNAVSNLIREGKTFQIASVMQTGKGQGMQTQADALLTLVSSGMVTAAEAYTRAIDAAFVKGALERAGHALD